MMDKLALYTYRKPKKNAMYVHNTAPYRSAFEFCFPMAFDKPSLTHVMRRLDKYIIERVTKSEIPGRYTIEVGRRDDR